MQFNSEIIFIASFVPNCFSSTIFFKVFIQVSNLNLSNSLLKSEDIAIVHDQNLLHATLLKEVFPFPEELQYNISADIKIWWQCSSTVDTYKFYRSFSFPIMTQNLSFFRFFWVIHFQFSFRCSKFFKTHMKTSFLSHAL